MSICLAISFKASGEKVLEYDLYIMNAPLRWFSTLIDQLLGSLKKLKGAKELI